MDTQQGRAPPEMRQAVQQPNKNTLRHHQEQTRYPPRPTKNLSSDTNKENKTKYMYAYPLKKNPGIHEYKPSLYLILVTGTSSIDTQYPPSIGGSSTREVANNEYPGTRCFTPGNPRDDNC